MEITLEKIELVKDRTGISYKEAKEALEAADGSVVDAIITIEESIDNKEKISPKEQGTALVDMVKSMVKKGNVSRIVVRNSNEEPIVNIPVNAGLVGALVAPWGLLAAAIASIGFKCVVEIIKDDGTIIDVSERASDFAGKAVEKGSEWKDVAVEKAQSVQGKVWEKTEDAFDTAKEKAGDAYDVAKEKAGDAYDVAKEKAGDAYDVAKEKATEAYDKAKDKVKKADEENDGYNS